MNKETNVELVFDCAGNEFVVTFSFEFSKFDVESICMTKIESLDENVAIDAEVFEIAIEIAEAHAEQVLQDYVASIETKIADYWLP